MHRVSIWEGEEKTIERTGECAERHIVSRPQGERMMDAVYQLDSERDRVPAEAPNEGRMSESNSWLYRQLCCRTCMRAASTLHINRRLDDRLQTVENDEQHTLYRSPLRWWSVRTTESVRTMILATWCHARNGDAQQPRLRLTRRPLLPFLSVLSSPPLPKCPRSSRSLLRFPRSLFAKGNKCV